MNFNGTLRVNYVLDAQFFLEKCVSLIEMSEFKISGI